MSEERNNDNVTLVKNVTNEFLFVGCIYKNPDFFIEYGQNIKSKFDFSDEATIFFYDMSEIMYQKRTQTFNKTSITTFMSEDEDRLKLYKKYGGYKTLESWMTLAIIDDIKNYFEVLKKYSLLREYDRNGFNVQKIINHPKFEMFTAMDIYRMIRSKADRIHTIILTNEESQILNTNIKKTLLQCMETPDLGLQMPFEISNDIFRGMKRKSCMAVGMLSNAGKTRYMMKLVAYITLVLKEKVFVMLNEMTVEEVRYALITSVINNLEFQQLYGFDIKKKEKEFTLGLYKDDRTGDFIYPYKDDWGDTIESIEEYAERVSNNSTEYNFIMKIADWIEDETQGLIYVKDVSGAYDDKTLEFEIRKANLTHGISYFFYDTFKQDVQDTGDWSAMKATATKLTEVAKQQDMFGYLSIQLTDDTNRVLPHELSSMNIANCKNVKHVLHSLILFKEIEKEDFHKYGYITNSDWGKHTVHELDLSKRYYVGNVDKNRFGRKTKLLYEVDLDYNTWYEIGELVVKSTRK